ncbi:MAG TPA: TetR/AcrR family transcriptional regulator [Mycobacterium sp.]|nr:TetR family transcriptional regulator [Mycobacterium sp.]MCB9417648.1 TetR family transcriptional regulator [Mycolicibacterium sp.]MCB0940022.1 TetR family transcriptional regulator [Mycobacterium sp.]MCB0946807.1 TetR family transcriptional regulator [Mycobacterium sp.]TXI54762.1 MAG: TetR family transcriptional regulator [Mycobacterium sp.]
MATLANREAYFETGLDVLADLGYGGLKLAEVCNRLGVTTGSFYHYFASWPAYCRELITFWVQDRTVRMAQAFSAVSDPRERMQVIIRVALSLPHGAEAAIRAWSSVDADVHKVQVEVDRERFKVCYDYAMDIVGDERQAEVFADWCVYMLVGYEQATLSREPRVYEWISNQMLDALDSGSFGTVPPR